MKQLITITLCMLLALFHTSAYASEKRISKFELYFFYLLDLEKYSQNADYDGIIKRLSDGIKTLPNDEVLQEVTYCLLGVAYLEKGDLQKAAEHIKQARAIDPTSALPIAAEVNIDLANGNISAALSLCESSRGRLEDTQASPNYNAVVDKMCKMADATLHPVPIKTLREVYLDEPLDAAIKYKKQLIAVEGVITSIELNENGCPVYFMPSESNSSFLLKFECPDKIPESAYINDIGKKMILVGTVGTFDGKSLILKLEVTVPLK